MNVSREDAASDFFEILGKPRVAISFGRDNPVYVDALVDTSKPENVTKLYDAIDRKARDKKSAFICWSSIKSVGEGRDGKHTLSEGGVTLRDEQPVLFIDLDRAPLDVALYDKLTARPCVVLTSPSGGDRRHVLIRVVGAKPEQAQRLRYLAKVALGGDHKHNPVSWLRPPFAPSFKNRHDGACAAPERVVRDGSPWEADEIEAVLEEAVSASVRELAALRARPLERGAIEPEAVDEERLPTNVRVLLKAGQFIDEGDRSTKVYAVAMSCMEAGFTNGEVRWVLDSFTPATEKWSDAQIDADIHRVRRDCDIKPIENEITREKFWHARPYLRHTYDYAVEYGLNPWATLGAAMARVNAAIPPSIVLIGGKSVNLSVSLWGPSGANKGETFGMARKLVPYIDTPLELINPASGEALRDLFTTIVKTDKFEQSEDGVLLSEGEAGEAMRVGRVNAAIFEKDEASTLLGSMNRAGNTLIGALLAAMQGEATGRNKADSGGKRDVGGTLQENRYRMPTLVGLQPKYAEQIFAYEEGLPQRLLFFSVVRELGQPRPAMRNRRRTVEPLTFEDRRDHLGPMTSRARQLMMRTPAPHELREITYSDRVAHEIDDWEALLPGDPGWEAKSRNPHGMLTRLRVAVTLMWLDGRDTEPERNDEAWALSDDDWDLAGQVCDESTRVRDELRAFVSKNKHKARVEKRRQDLQADDEAIAEHAQATDVKVREHIVRLEAAWFDKKGRPMPESHVTNNIRGPVESARIPAALATLVDDGALRRVRGRNAGTFAYIRRDRDEV
ncbi:hypothetical protein [Tsukamurella tyrosinosolvens]|uniref:hypothetical protein n=1 Tax=Tsukamurella tyrosinosolvens TaxID=57704 RepID=UPI003F4A2902